MKPREGVQDPSDRVDRRTGQHAPGLLERRTAQSAQALRSLLGPFQLEPVTPDIGRPFYRTVTALDALAIIETPSGGAEGGSTSL